MAKENSEGFTGYELSRNWFDWCFENPEKINTNHTAMYCFIIEHSNRLGWKPKFGLPTEMVKEAIGIRNYRTYRKTFDDLVEWGFIKLLEKSKNQYSSCIIALCKNTKATSKATSKALQKHRQKQVQSIVCIDKPINQEPITNNNSADAEIKNFPLSGFIPEKELDAKDLVQKYKTDELWVASATKNLSLKGFHVVYDMLDRFSVHLEAQKDDKKTEKDFRNHFLNWARKQKTDNQPENTYIPPIDHF